VTTLLRDRYAVGELIGSGGAARVHLATDRVLGRRVAVKVLDDSVARSADPAGRARFLAEVRTAATVAHPNLVAIYDAGEDNGELFLVMEYVEGVTLAELLARRTPLPVDEAVSIAAQTLDGLAAVHRHGTIHRDVKPANILVGDDGRVRLADFGIAKRLDDIAESVTATGTLVGSPGYLAPEQSAGLPLSPATDVYQAGVVLFEMLTGRRPTGTPPADPRTARPDLPAAVAAVVVRATDADPSARYPTATEMRGALEEARRASHHTLAMPVAPATTVLEPVAHEPRTAGRRPLLAAAFAAVLVLVVGVGALATRGDDDNELLPGPTTIPVVAVTSPPAPTIALTVPPAPTPAEPEPEPAPRSDSNGNGNGRGNGNGKKQDD
jgi:eukaryotic-like serine/threonine-protein kinase